MKFAPHSPASARASSVLPVPGGPSSSTPRGARAPTAVYCAGAFMKAATRCNDFFASSAPITSAKQVSGFSASGVRPAPSVPLRWKYSSSPTSSATGSSGTSAPATAPRPCANFSIGVRSSITTLASAKPLLALSSGRRAASPGPQAGPQSIKRVLCGVPRLSVYSRSVPSTPTALSSRAASARSNSDTSAGLASQRSGAASKARATALLRATASRLACSCSSVAPSSAPPSSRPTPPRINWVFREGRGERALFITVLQARRHKGKAFRARRKAEETGGNEGCSAARYGQSAFQRVDEHLGDVEAGLLRDFLEAGRAGDVDLGEAVADHVQPGEQQPPGGH